MTGAAADVFPFFEQLSEAGRREVRLHAAQQVNGSRLLLSRGEHADGAYFVVRGSLRVYYVTPEGREATLYRVEPGGTCLLALTSTFNEEPYPAWVESGRLGVTLIKVPTAAFRRLFDGEPGFREFLFRVLSGRIFALMQVLEEAGSARVEQRVAGHLLRAAATDGVVRASQQEIASELGTAREVVFRSLRALVEQGLITTARRRVTVVDRDGLRRVVDATRERG